MSPEQSDKISKRSRKMSDIFTLDKRSTSLNMGLRISGINNDKEIDRENTPSKLKDKKNSVYNRWIRCDTIFSGLNQERRKLHTSFCNRKGLRK